MGPVGVVVVDLVGHELLELAPVPDDGAIGELAADRSDPSFSEGVGNWSAHARLRPMRGLRTGRSVSAPNTRSSACDLGHYWYPVRDLNPCYHLERVAS